MTNTRTGRTYATVAIGTADEALRAAGIVGTVHTHTVITPSGKAFSTTYSEYWMDPAYVPAMYGVPTTAQKQQYTDAVTSYATALQSIGSST